LGDTAVAVNPKDKRYKKYIGKIYEIDFVGVALKLKIIADRAVDAEFGTGAVGVTPAHSMVDWQMAQEHNLEIVKVINEDGNIVDGLADYSSKTVEQAREMIVKKLKEQGLLEKEEEIENNLSLCYRCNTPIEPLPSLQWFINVNKKIPKYNKTIKELSVEAVKKGVFGREKIRIIPERFEKNYFHWMENLRDWCISRQIWFGHRVPVWYRLENRKQKTESGKKVDITYFVHGTTIDNERNVASGHYDVGLSKLGIEQSKKLGELMKEKQFDVIFCSDLKRAVDSAKLAFGNRGIKIIQDKRLRECDYGDLTRKGVKEYKSIMQERINKPFSKGESYKDVENRIQEFLEEVKSKYGGKKIAIVAHQGPQLALDVVLKGKIWQQAIDEDWRKKKAWQPGWEYKLTGEEIYVGVEPPKGKGWKQDEDTLDTWFSSGLWTFSTLANSPDQIKIKDGKLVIDSDDFKNFHPTSVMETGYDILFFWVARMIIMTTYAVGDIPFKDVYLHGLVRDEKGRKMSKSLGNAIDPLDVCAKYGTDAVRLSLIIGTTPGNDLNLSEEKIAGYRNFTNKLWNIARYILQTTANSKQQTANSKATGWLASHSVADEWILQKMQKLIKQVSDDLDNYRFSQAGERLRDFTWNDFADWYIEVSKFEKNNEKDKILIMILQDLLKLWHPFMPFVTEVIWSETGEQRFLMVEKWPSSATPVAPLLARGGAMDVKKATDGKPSNDFELIKNVIVAIRNARSENKVEPARKIKAIIYGGKSTGLIKSQEHLIKNLRTGIKELEIKPKGAKIKGAIYITVDNIEIYLVGAVDEEKEKIRIKK
ncbi:class I tRNA ligase family protein, partial [Candidatus Parcubacteria bacterium]|nr:class I tRNA ligase family protein [Candidatus Parcubacteria bacterium]